MGGKTLQTRTGLGKLYREIAHRHSHGGAAQVELSMAHLAMSAMIVNPANELPAHLAKLAGR